MPSLVGSEMCIRDRAKKQLGEMKRPASTSQTSTRGRQRSDNKPPQSNGQYCTSGQRQETRQTIPRDELERGKALRGRCFRCGKNDNLLPDCPCPAHHTCSTCGKRGHIRTAFTRANANNASSRAEEEEHQLTSRMSAMSINNPLDASNQHQLQHGSAQAVHSLYSNAANQPAPTMLL